MTNTVVLHIGDVRDVLDRLIADAATADMAVTSPPFLALRSYLPADHVDKHREIGSEPTPAAFLDTLYGWTAQLGALLPDWASIAVEIGDTMANSGGAGGDYNADGMRAGQPKFRSHRPGPKQREQGAEPGWPLSKSMCLIPHSYTFGLVYGHNPITGTPSPAGRWRVRNVIAWARPNPPVGSLGKRNPHARTGDYKFRPATSYITVACRGTGRYFDLDAVRTEHAPASVARADSDAPRRFTARVNASGIGGTDMTRPNGAPPTNNPAGAPPLDWHTDDLDGDWLWKLATAPYKGSHYATFPLTLPRRLIQAMCPLRVCTVCGWPSERITGEATYVKTQATNNPSTRCTTPGVNGSGADPTFVHGRANKITNTLGWTDCGHDDAWRPGRVLDPFGGSGTTAVAAALEGRDAVLIDIDESNVDLVRRRLNETVRIVSETVDGDTVTWTVDQAAPSQAKQVTGQWTLDGIL